MYIQNYVVKIAKFISPSNINQCLQNVYNEQVTVITALYFSLQFYEFISFIKNMSSKSIRVNVAGFPHHFRVPDLEDLTLSKRKKVV